MKFYESKRPVYEALGLAVLLLIGGIYGYIFMKMTVIAYVCIVVSIICIAISVWRVFSQSYIDISDDGFWIVRGEKSEFYGFGDIQSVGTKTIETKKHIQLLNIKFKKPTQSSVNFLIFFNEKEALMDARYASIHKISKILNEKLEIFNAKYN